MKCLSLWQPWAMLLVSGAKHVETRSWPIQHRGPLLIHAAKKWTRELADLSNTDPFKVALHEASVRVHDEYWKQVRGMEFGAIIGRVDVVECFGTDDVVVDDELAFVYGGGVLAITSTERLFGDYSPKRFALLCSNQMRFDEPIPYRGTQGLFEVPGEVLK